MEVQHAKAPIVVTDSACDLRGLEAVPVLAFPQLSAAVGRSELTDEQFFARLAAGEEFITCQLTASDYYQFFLSLAERGPVVYLAVASALSASFASAQIARRQLLKERPELSVSVLDSCAAGSGQRLLVEAALRLAQGGAEARELCAWVTRHKQRVQQWLLMGDLGPLAKGGRLLLGETKVKTFESNAVLRLDAKGHLVPVCRKGNLQKSCKKLAKLIAKAIAQPEDQTIMLSYACQREMAEELKWALTESLPLARFEIEQMPRTLAIHTGATGLAISFWGEPRA